MAPDADNIDIHMTLTAIAGVTAPPVAVGQSVCEWGQGTGHEVCGTVLSLDHTITFPDTGIYAPHLVQATFCGMLGDSGGTVYQTTYTNGVISGYAAVGVMNGFDSTDPPGCAVFTPLTTIINAFHLDILAQHKQGLSTPTAYDAIWTPGGDGRPIVFG